MVLPVLSVDQPSSSPPPPSSKLSDDEQISEDSQGTDVAIIENSIESEVRKLSVF